MKNVPQVLMKVAVTFRDFLTPGQYILTVFKDDRALTETTALAQLVAYFEAKVFLY